MKFLVLFLLAVTSFQASALADNSGQVTLSASNVSQSIQVTDQKYDPVYGQEPYQTTCSQQVFDHNETQCTTTMDNVCHEGGEVCDTVNDSVCNSRGCTTGPRRECHQAPPVCTDVPRQSCTEVPVYRTDYYSCTQYRTVVVGQTLTKTFNHTINVSVTNAAILSGGANLAITVNVSQDKVLTAQLTNSYPNALLNYVITTVSQDDSSSVLNSVESIVIDEVASASLLNAFQASSISNLALGKNAIRFNIANAAGLENELNLEIKLVRTPKAWFSHQVFDTTVDSSTLSLVSQGSDINAIVPFAKLSEKSLQDVRYSLYVTANLKAGTVLNPSDFNSLSGTLTQSLIKVKPSF